MNLNVKQQLSQMLLLIKLKVGLIKNDSLREIIIFFCLLYKLLCNLMKMSVAMKNWFYLHLTQIVDIVMIVSVVNNVLTVHHASPVKNVIVV